MEAVQVKALISSALKATTASIKSLTASNKSLQAQIEQQAIEIQELKEMASLNLRNAVITIDPKLGTIKIDTDNGSIETKVINSGVVSPPIVPVVPVPPAPFDPFCKKAAEQYLKDNLDLKAGGVTVDTALNHYNSHGKREGRVWKSELCK
jgi:hypothetical protein